MGRCPITLYKEQWLKLLGMSDEIHAFIAADESQLNTKEQRRPDCMLWPHAKGHMLFASDEPTFEIEVARLMPAEPNQLPCGQYGIG
jgi:hypothetical protein